MSKSMREREWWLSTMQKTQWGKNNKKFKHF